MIQRWTPSLGRRRSTRSLLPTRSCSSTSATRTRRFTSTGVGTRSDAARSEIPIAPETLAKYAGTYTERQPFWQAATVARVFEIRLADGALFLGQTRLRPQWETVFDNAGLAIEFVTDTQGVTTHLFDKHVSGDYRFDRTR
jgi:hypothetical protein